VKRLVVVSNRVGPVRAAAKAAGGLAVALVDALRERGGLWFGWSGRVGEGVSIRVERVDDGPLTLLTMDLSQRDFDAYYNGFANQMLWPLFHYRVDLSQFERAHFEGYNRVNTRFAQALFPRLLADDLIWVHDYHFIPFATQLRAMGCEQRMGFFLHIPFPAPEILVTLPVHQSLVRALFAYDLIGLQTEADRVAFINYCVQENGGRIVDDHHVEAFGRTVEVRAFPVGIDTDHFARLAGTPGAKERCVRMSDVLHGQAQIIGVDRLDYTKGLPERFRAFGRLLETYPENRGRVTLMQIAPTTRTDVEDYVDLRHELEGISGHVNGRFAEFDWTPIRYISRSFGRKALAGLYRASRVGLVTPLRDGMNLVAKEFVAAQNPDNPGALVLSRFTGAARQMDAAVIVNPYDTEGVAEALQGALRMPLEERIDRWRSMMDGLCHDNVDKWRNDFLIALGGGS